MNFYSYFRLLPWRPGAGPARMRRFSWPVVAARQELRPPSGVFAVAALVFSGFLIGCGELPERMVVTETVTRSEYRPPAQLHASSEERFRLAMPQQQPAPMQMSSAEGGGQPELFHFEVPQGWVELPPTSMRLINLAFGENGAGEAYLTFLSDGGGGVVANVNRWRSQMGLEPMTEAEIAALPTKPLFGRPATFVDIEGTYSGMADPTPKPNYRLMGVLLEHGGQGIFLKMVGPKSDMAGQEDNLDLLLSTIHLNQDGHSHEPRVTEAPQETQVAQAPSQDSGTSSESAQGLAWDAPEGWTRAGDRPMRLVTFTAGDAECYVTVLGPGGGGLMANLNRWLAQFGKPPLEEGDLAALPTITVLGKEVPLLEAEGDFTGMGGTTLPDQRLLAVACPLPDKSVFIKMTGPAADVEAQRDAFIAFSESLREQ